MIKTIPIEDISKRLHSDEARLTFLKEIYTVGDTVVGDLILSINPQDIDVLEGEVEYAKEHGQEKRFVDLAKRFADSYIENNWGKLLENIVIDWGNTEIAEHVIGRFFSKADQELPLKYAAKIAEAFGKKDEAKRCLEKLLEIQIQGEGKYSSSIAETYVRLGDMMRL